MAIPREVGPFELLDPLGAGGMGEVFRARDTRLNRFVAIKFLPEAASTQARERFQREALAIAALNHPHICTLYEVGEDHGRPYLVMELLEGETLYARLQRGPVALAQLVQWGSEIADALQAAHAKGILHRDLKPANIFITPRGAAKVLDFGLAQITAAVDAEAETIAGSQLGAAGMPPLTAPGTTMGTYAYMSPEQARGHPTDARSDIFSLGVVLYEMAAGKRPFDGRTTADLSAAILTFTPPPPSALRAKIPPRLDDIIAQCLEKDPGLRFQSATDLRLSLRRLLGPSSSAAAPAAAVAPPAARRRPWLWPAVIAVIVAAGAFSWRQLRSPAPAPAAVPQLQLRQLTFGGDVIAVAISPEAKFLAYTDVAPGGDSLHLLSIASGSDVQIVPPGHGCCLSPSFSPDGSEVYFLQGRALKAVPVLGGAVRGIAGNACDGAGVSPDGARIAYVARPPGGSSPGLMVARADGSGARLLHTPAPGTSYTSYCWSVPGRPVRPPAWSPDGRWIAAPVSGPQGGRIELVNAATGEAHDLKPVLFPAVDMSWLPNSRGLVFTNGTPSQVWEISVPGGKLARLTNDLEGYLSVSVAKTGQLALLHVVPNVSVWAQSRAGGAFRQLPGGGATMDGAAGLAWTPQGAIVSTRNLGGHSQLWIASSDGSGGHALPIAQMPPDAHSPAVAPNGQIVFDAGATNNRVFRVGADGAGLMPLSPLAANHGASYPTLALGGREVVYDRGGGKPIHPTLWAVPLAGGAAHEVWPGEVFYRGNPASPGGNRILVIGHRPDAGGPEPAIIRLDGKKPQVTWLATFPKRTRKPFAWTPDGRAVTYVQQRGGTGNIWAFPLNRGKAGGTPYAITHFASQYILAYAFNHDGRLAVSRGSGHGDAVLATGLVKKP